jgi:hypothetical protein
MVAQSSPSRRASMHAERLVSTPSACAPPMLAVMSASFSPLPIRSPTVRLRDRSPVQVSTRSPMPPRPSIVSGCAPSAVASVVTSARPVGLGGCMGSGLCGWRRHGACRYIWAGAPTRARAGGAARRACGRAAALTARDERRARVVAEVKPVADAARDREHVLERAAELDACRAGACRRLAWRMGFVACPRLPQACGRALAAAQSPARTRHVGRAVAPEEWRAQQLLRGRRAGGRGAGSRGTAAGRKAAGARACACMRPLLPACAAPAAPRTCTSFATASSRAATVTIVGRPCATCGGG